MHEQAEFGIAAHWQYKEGRPGDEDLKRSLAWVRQLLEGNIDLTEAHEFLEALKIDLYQDEIFVFTPERRPQAACHAARRRSTSPTPSTRPSATAAPAHA